jgi:hypothetical protein
MERRLLLSTLIVNTADDNSDPNQPTLSLREAIEIVDGTLAVSSLSPTAQLQVSGTSSAPAQDYIAFNIAGGPSSGPIVLALKSALPAITSPVIIDGYSQPGSSENPSNQTDIDTAVLKINLDGFLAGPNANGLTINSANCLIDGLEITRFSGAGIAVADTGNTGSPGNLIVGNFIGTTTDTANGDGRSYPTGLGNGGAGLLVMSSNNRFGGNTPGLRNVIYGNSVGVSLTGTGATGNLIQGNFILDNANQGVLVASSNNTIGEALKGGGNDIAGNGGAGVEITGGPDIQGNNIVGNDIGTDIGFGTGSSAIPLGVGPRPNGAQGVLIDNSPNNTIGSLIADGKNVIAANLGDGVLIQGAASVGNRLLNNWIGFNIVNGLESLNIPNVNGVHITSSGNTIGGTTTAALNVIDLNLRNGILVDGPGATGNVVQGNIVGLNPGGGSDFGNTLDGILIQDAAGNTVGGSDSGAGNTISGNNNGVEIVNTGSNGPGAATGNLVAGNLIGTGTDGVSDLGNAVDGVVLTDAPRNTIGGIASGAGNVISGNNRGIRITGSGSQGDLVEGNFIGTDRTATAVIHNKIDGVLVTAGAQSNTVGGTSAGAGNTIAYNVGNGVRIESGVNNAVLSNKIFSNNQLGINLVGGTEDSFGVTANTPGGPHVGPNNLQNDPVLITAAPSGNATFVQGTFNSRPNTTFTIQFFSSSVKDPSGHGQGQTPIGSTTVTTDGAGNASIAQNVPVAVPSGQFITATATDPNGNTSEFSNAVPSVPVTIQFSSSSFSVNENDGTARVAITRAGGTGGAVGVSFATSDGTATAGTDYTATSGPIFFNAGETTKIVTIPIKNVHLVGTSQTINLTLTDPTNGSTLGSPSTATLTIVDNELASVAFSASSYVVNEKSGTASITVRRNSPNGTLSVHYATSDGTGKAGTNYRPASGTLTFSPGQSSLTFSVPLINVNTNGTATVRLTLSQPSGGILASPSTAVLTILETTTQAGGGGVGPGGGTTGPFIGPVPLTNTGQLGPILQDMHLLLGPGGIDAILLSFNEPLDPFRARNLASYGFFVASAGPDGYFGSPDDTSIPLASAQYNPATFQVLLTPVSPLPLKLYNRLIINGTPSATAGVTDTRGNLLVGDTNGLAPGPFIAVFGVSNRFAYTDRDGNIVALQLKKGLMELVRGADGEALQLRLDGTIPRRSVLSGHIKPSRTGNGTTLIPRIVGAAGVKLRLKRSIRVGQISATGLASPALARFAGRHG